MRNTIPLFVIITSLLCSACANTPATHFHVLESLTPPAPLTQTLTKGQSFGIGPLSLPSELEREPLVTRTGSQVQLAEFEHWAGALKENIGRVIAKNLTAARPQGLFRVYPWSAYGQVQYRVILDIAQFDAQLGKSATLDITWAIMREQQHEIISNGHLVLTQAVTDNSYGAMVLAMSQLLANFSTQLAQLLGQLA